MKVLLEHDELRDIIYKDNDKFMNLLLNNKMFLDLILLGHFL